MTENQSFLQEQQGRSQDFTFPRRELLQRLASAALFCLIPCSKPTFEIPQKYSMPKFAIGDQVSSPYIDEYGDEDESSPSELGEVMGVCWHPENQQWEYIVNWTAGSSSSWMYPVFDGFLLEEYRLRLVSHV